MIDSALTPVPVTIVTGFLGSGKTTIIQGLIRDLTSRGLRPAYIKNEFGDQDIDAQLMQGQHIQTRELLNGCICCTLVGPFTAAINELLTSYQPDWLVIEASGAADPAAISLMVSNHPRLRRDGVISIIDVLNFEGYHDISTTARHQAEFTDLLVFNKVELADLDQKRRVVGYVRELNEFAPIVEAPHGELNPLLAFGQSRPELKTALAQAPNHQHHLETDELDTKTVTVAPQLTYQQLGQILSLLPKNVIRAKGFVTLADGQTWLVNRVGQRQEITVMADFRLTEASHNQLVLIGFQVPDLQAQFLVA